MALSAFADGPYGFSFELKRTIEVAALRLTGSRAKLAAGRVTAAAAPAPRSCANRRREMEIVFMFVDTRFVICRTGEYEIELAERRRLYFEPKSPQPFR